MSFLAPSASAATGCLKLCVAIGQQLLTAKHNKKECESLRTAIACIEAFLRKIPLSSVSAAGTEAFEALHGVLEKAQAFLVRVGDTGPLVSLLSAAALRDDYLRINRDLTNTFQILAAGEKLLDLTTAKDDIPSIQRELNHAKTLFLELEHHSSRLKEIAAAAQQHRRPEQLLHQALLDQLQDVQEVIALSPEELLTELQALQLAALYGLDMSGAGMGKAKSLGDHTEDFLVQQLCAALSPKAARANQPLMSAAAPDIPPDFICPIGQDIMVHPVTLSSTGGTYEAANIKRWLDTHSTCPATGTVLSDVGLIPNDALKNRIEAWAQQHGIVLPIALDYVPLLGGTYVANADPQAQNATSTASLGAGAPMVSAATITSKSTGSSPAARAARSPAVAGTVKAASSRKARHCRCTRTLWAIALCVAAIILTAAVGVTVGLVLRAKGHSSNDSKSNSDASNTTSVHPPTSPPSAQSPTQGAITTTIASPASSNSAQSPLIPAVQYVYKSVNGTGMPLDLPVTPVPGLALTRWVLSAWSISNLTAPARMLDSGMQPVQQLINNFTRMSPGQVQLSATVNVTIPYVFQGISKWTPAATAAMQQAASAAAGGYDSSCIMVLLDTPDFGMKVADFLDTYPASITNVFTQRQVEFYPVSESSTRSFRRQLLQHSSPQPSAAANSSTVAPWGPDGPVSNGKNPNHLEWTHVWVSYQNLDPQYVTVLLNSLAASCGGEDLTGGVNIAATMCGQYTEQLLQGVGLHVDAGMYVQYVKDKPMVSVNMRLAVGVTQREADFNTDTLVAIWLAQPRNFVGIVNMSGQPDPVGPNALIKWIAEPEIWGAQVPPVSNPATTAGPSLGGNSSGLSAGAIAGIALGCSTFTALIGGLGLYLIDRKHKQQQLQTGLTP